MVGEHRPRAGSTLTRRQVLAGGVGLVASAAAGGLLYQAWQQLGREDLIPGDPPTLRLDPHGWDSTADHLSFAVIGDNGSGGRQAMAVAEQLAQSYQRAPFGLLCMLGDIVYYGPVSARWDDVFREPLGPLIDAGVGFEVALGNHDGDLLLGAPRLAEVDAVLDRLGTPARFFTTTHGPVDFFYLDSVALLRHDPIGLEGADQLAWLDEALEASTNRWRVVCSHHPVFSSGIHGSTPRLVEHLQPILAHHDVDLFLAGHDHHYERTVPIEGVTHVVSGAGCKLTPVLPRDFTVAATSTLEFLRLDVDGGRLTGRAIDVDGGVLDRFELRARRPA